MFRFVPVYGTWGRPDSALHKFVDAILDDRPIDIYSRGGMYRDCICVDNLVRGIRLLMDAVLKATDSKGNIVPNNSYSSVAPFGVVKVGNSKTAHLLGFIDDN